MRSRQKHTEERKRGTGRQKDRQRETDIVGDSSHSTHPYIGLLFSCWNSTQKVERVTDRHTDRQTDRQTGR